ncbi:hypothetical protein 44RRORF187c [Aeromonas phage 44RR2.8t]|uniref:NAD(+)--arginine ADP-ribosyltransferase n=2 Tax=Biquartavirus 44RR2 TaxID=115987 RepID=Q6U9B5_9CAUD|nr:Alt-like RNA polymerase ADP-ribosyltransferase [Aeromonas phage 44RR2.8t]AAQ81505.1 hypothetical protein 44RRORF187c [Aeromonas phage 44RR2.8t]APU00659.1 RNA polymerase-ADP-ribosyltransferase [Aeromonas phage 44RR2.8t.2]
MVIDNAMDGQLNEVFDSAMKFNVANLTPKAKVPHMMAIAAAGKENLVVRFCNYAAKGDAVKQVKPGDKFMQVQIMQMSDKGNLQVLKGGLGSDPIDAMNAICDTTIDVMKLIHADACLIRFPIKQLQGQSKTLARIAERIVNKRGKGMFQYVPGMAKFENKYMYILVARKSKQLADIKGLGIDPELYEIVPAAVGEVVIDKKTGEKVTKVEAVEGTLAAKENKRSPRSVLTGAHLDKKAFLDASRALTSDKFANSLEIHGDRFENPDEITALGGKTSPESEAIGVIVNSPRYGNGDLGQVDLPYEVVKKYEVVNAKNMASLAYDISEYLSPRFDELTNKSESLTREKYIENHMVDMMRAVNDSQRKKMSQVISFADVYNEKHMTNEVSTAVKQYTGVYYEDINDVFVLNMKPGEREERWIKGLDKGFKNIGMKLPEGMSVYRGMKVASELANISLANKMFYFSNYVSCSFTPNIFGSGIGGNKNISKAMISSEETQVAEQKKTFFGFAVHDVQVPVIIPGNTSKHPHENEVILPRGTTFKFTAVSKAEIIDPDYSFSSQTTVWAECIAVSASSLNESDVVYDGDHLMETGELKIIQGFSSFLSESVVADEAQKLNKAQVGRNILASIISDEDMSPKFYN